MGKVSDAKASSITNILVSQPQPAHANSPYWRLAARYQLRLDFRPFIKVEPLSFYEFRKQKIDITEYTAVIFMSRGVIEQFFRLLQTGKIAMSATTKYFCIAEQTANYLQKYVVKRRKVFKGKGTAKDLAEVISKHCQEHFLLPRADKDPNFMADFLKKNAYKYKEAFISKTMPNDLSDVPITHYDMITFFSTSGIKAFFKNFPKFERKDAELACFGAATAKLLKELGFIPAIEAPLPNVPSMVDALELYLKGSFNE